MVDDTQLLPRHTAICLNDTYDLKRQLTGANPQVYRPVPSQENHYAVKLHPWSDEPTCIF